MSQHVWQAVGGTLLTVLLCLSADVQAKITDIPALKPPAIDVKTQCRVAMSSSTLPPDLAKRDWKTWNGTPAITPDQLVILGRYYSLGSEIASYNPALAVKFLKKAITITGTHQKRAELILGKLYQNGAGIAQDTEEATRLLTNAMKSGMMSATYQLAMMAEKEENYATAATFYQREAQNGSAKALIALAVLYDEGLIIPEQENAARDNFILAQNIMLERLGRGDCNALYTIGLLYMRDKVIPRNGAVAAPWFEKAVEAGSVKAMMRLSELYKLGAGVSYDIEKSIALLKKAADSGSSEAMYLTGQIHLIGDGVPKDRTLAIEWLTKAAKQNNQKSIETLADIYLGEYGDAPDYNASIPWIKEALTSDRPLPRLVLEMGKAYELGRGVPKDTMRAFALYEQASAAGDDRGLFRLGESYMFGRGTKQNPRYALRFFRLSAELGNVDAMLRLKEIFTKGIGGAINLETANRWTDRSITKGSSSSMMERARVLVEQNTPESLKKAVDFYERAENDGSREAMVRLGAAYLHGRGIEKNTALADEWFARAIQDGDKQSRGFVALAKMYWQGVDVEKDEAKALDFALKGEKANDNDARMLLALWYRNGGETIIADEQKSINYIVDAARQFDEQAMMKLARLMLQKKVPADLATDMNVTSLLQGAAEQGNIKAIRLMGTLAEETESREKALEWYKIAATLGDTVSLARLADAYTQGAGVPQDTVKANAYYLQAAQQGHTKSMRKLGSFYLNKGDSSDDDAKDGVAWLTKAAENGDVKAMNEIANAYAAGFKVAESPKEALHWWKIAADAGDEEAKAQLKLLDTSNYGD